ncbi:MAG: beta-ketoacyl-ACP synthase III [Candidatus Latescibacterota bacterium]|nr:beta-ketoacyl-ACP synthase III [Candidatus Latescibacterota bacterium]
MEQWRKYGAVVTEAAHFLPERIVTNADVSELVDTTDEWIRERTGIEERRFLDQDKPTSYMAIQVARSLLEKSNIDPLTIDLVIVATVTPDMVFPATACIVQAAVGAKNAWAYDLSAACSGFVYALVTASQFIHTGAHRRVMVIGADKMSSILDMNDRNTCVLFGDGAGGVILDRSEDCSTGLLDFLHLADGSDIDSLNVLGGGSLNPASHESVDQGLHFVRQDGRSVFKFAVRKMAEVSADLLNRNELSGEDLKLFIPHQANLRIIDAAAERLKLPPEKVLVNIDRYANTTAATIPIALSQACDEKRLQAGDLVLMTGVGAGLTWGSALYRWGGDYD